MPIPVPGRVAEELRRSTVQVYCGRGRQEGGGSGVVLTGDRVITNAHVLRGERVSVESWEGRVTGASLLQVNRRRDLAVLSVPGLGAPGAVLGDSDHLQSGTPVFAVGNPLGFSGAVSSGIIHSLGPAHSIGSLPWIQADVRLAPGNSGGPLANFLGQVIGINTMIVAGGFVTGGLALAIPSRAVQSFLAVKGSPPSLGVVVRPIRLRKGEIGMMILELVAGGSAETASLMPGDILIGSNGSRFERIEDLQSAIDQGSGSIIRLDFYRAGQEIIRHVAVQLVPDRVLSAA